MDRISRWLTRAAFAIAAAAFVLAPILAVSWSRRPFPGFVMEQTLVVTDYSGPGWSGRLDGIAYPEQIIRLDGRLVADQAQFDSAIGRLATGQEISVTTVLPDGTQKTYPSIQVRDFAARDLLRLFGVPYGVGLVYLLIGAWVYRVRGHTRPGRAFAFFCSSNALVTGLFLDLISTHVLSFLWTAAIALQGAALISLALLFPEEWRPLGRRDWLPALPYLISAGLIGWGLAALYSPSNPWAYVKAWRASYIYAALGIAVFLGLTLYRQRTSRSLVTRQQARVISWGSMAAFLPVGIWLAAPILGIDIRFNPLLFLPFMLFFPLSLAVAILRYRLWDIDVIINRTFVYGVLTLVLGLLYYGGVMGLQQLSILLRRGNSQLAVAGSTLAIAALFNPLRRRVQAGIDRRFYRRRYDIAQTLANFGETLRNEVDLTRLTERLEAVIWDTLQPAHCFTWLRTSSNFRPFLGDEVHRQWIQTEISADDPLAVYISTASGAVELDRLSINSPALESLRSAMVKLVVPFISQGELVGWLSLGPRLSEREFSADDRALLWNLGTQAGPAVHVAQLVRAQQAEALQRERLEHELRLARLIQQTLLPQAPPAIPGWDLAVHYHPAGVVGGDFYDFLLLPNGRLFLTVGDVTDKGIPAALVMATIRSMLRGTARGMFSPSAALERVNELLWPETPPHIFVTCLYAVLDIRSGHLQYANAGHNLPLRRRDGVVQELRATGMPLGLMPDVRYDQAETVITPGECLVFYSDGLTEAHNTDQEMFGDKRLHACLERSSVEGPALIECMLAELASFVGPDRQQEDDVTLMTLIRAATELGGEDSYEPTTDKEWWKLDEFALPSEPGNERVIMERVAATAQGFMSVAALEQLKTAVAEAALNGIEHGNRFRAELPVTVEVLLSGSRDALAVRVTDRAQADRKAIPNQPAPDLEAKLAGQDTPRGWGLFLIHHMTDELNVYDEENRHTLELIFDIDRVRIIPPSTGQRDISIENQENP